MVNNEVIYAEVYEILKQMDKSIVMKIPIEVLNVFKNQRDKNYISRIDLNDLFNPNNVEKKTRDIIAWLDLEYWATEEEKKELIEKYKRNEIIAEQKKKADYENKYNEIFSEKTGEQVKAETNSVDIDKELCVIEDTWFEKIKKIIKRIINKY